MKKIAIFLVVIMIFGSLLGCGFGAKNEPTEPVVEEPKLSEVEVEPLTLTDTKYLESYEKKAINVPFNPANISPKVPAYEIAADLSNVENIEIFGTFTDEQKAAISKNGFFISPTGVNEWDEFIYDQIFMIYDYNEYQNIPSFVTGDSMTHIFHVFYSNLLRNLEKEVLYTKLTEMTEKLLRSNIATYNELENEKMKELQLKNVAFFAVGGKLLGMDLEYPEEAKSMVESELSKVEAKTGDGSDIVKGNVDYSQMTVRGHYTREEILEKYFLATMYYSQLGFYPFEDAAVNDDMILQAFLMTDSVYKDKEIFDAWSAVTDPIDFLVETSEDLSIRHYSKILYGVYGEKPDLNNLDSKILLDEAINLIRELPDPLIAPAKGKSFRFLPQRAVMDNVLMQNVVDVGRPSKRPIYSGLDMMVALGSKKAKEIQDADPYNKIWERYFEMTQGNIDTVKSLPDSAWQKNLYRGWLWTLKSYTNTFGEGYPIFMQNEAWNRKDLVSALGSYAELKHDTILYGKQVGAQSGGGAPVVNPKGYVEPNLELFEKISWLLEYTKVNLENRDMLGDYGEKIDTLKEMVDKCITLIHKELNNEAFTKEDEVFLMYIGGVMEYASISFVKNNGESLYSWYNIENETDRRMPIVTDLMNVVANVADVPEGKYQSIGTGAPAEIYVVYPHEGKLYMGRGGVFTYYEFLSDERLTDEAWQKQLMTEGAEIPAWYNDLVLEGKGEVIGEDVGY